MSAEFFLDTNILVYAVDISASPKKRFRAVEIVTRALTARDSCISFQVAQEFVSVTLQKFAEPLSASETNQYLDSTIMPLCAVWPSRELLKNAIDLKETTRFHFYDCLIIAAALEARCRVLLSEDLQHGRRLGGLRIENPFL
jgi:predicted nucleic acid-binding protein